MRTQKENQLAVLGGEVARLTALALALALTRTRTRTLTLTLTLTLALALTLTAQAAVREEAEQIARAEELAARDSPC